MTHLGFVALFAAFVALAGASVAYAISVSMLGGAVAGLVIGSLPGWLPRLVGSVGAARCAEIVAYLALLVVAVTVSVTGLLPALDDAPVRIEPSIPLLVMAPALYAAYLVLARREGAERGGSMPDRLGAALAGPPLVLTLALATAVATGAVLLIDYIGLNSEKWSYLASKFVDRGIIPPLTLVLFFWGLLLLAYKGWVLWRERQMLAAGRAESILLGAHRDAVDSRGDSATNAEAFLDIVWKQSADFYVVPRYINWAIPILGFIGTVLGISLAADGIGSIVGAKTSLGDLSTELGQAIAPLGIAFDTTLIALSLSVFLTLLQTALQRWEDGVLVDFETRVRAVPADGADGG